MTVETVIKLGLALLFGLLIGIDRQVKQKHLGLKPSMVICIASCLLTIVSIDVVIVSQTDPVTDVMKRLSHEESGAETFYYLHVTNENSRLHGVVSLRELIISSPDSLMKDIMSPQIISVPVDASQSEVLQIIRKYGLFAVPV